MCEKCGKTKKVPQSCKSRICSTCGKKHADEWSLGFQLPSEWCYICSSVKSEISITSPNIIFCIKKDSRCEHLDCGAAGVTINMPVFCQIERIKWILHELTSDILIFAIFPIFTKLRFYWQIRLKPI